MDRVPKGEDFRHAEDNATKINRKPYAEPFLESLGSLEEFTRQVHINISAL
jgi:hypothetical protein